MSAVNTPVRIERAHNGWIVTMGSQRMGDPAPPLPMVFDEFARMVDWLAEKYGLDKPSSDSLAWQTIQKAPYPRSKDDPFGLRGPLAPIISGG